MRLKELLGPVTRVKKKKKEDLGALDGVEGRSGVREAQLVNTHAPYQASQVRITYKTVRVGYQTVRAGYKTARFEY